MRLWYVQAFCDPIELQVLVSSEAQQNSAAQMAVHTVSKPENEAKVPTKLESGAASEQRRSRTPPSDVVLAAVASSVNVALSGDEVAAVVAVAAGLSAEISRELQAPLPQRISPEGDSRLGAIAAVSLKIPAVSLVAAGAPRDGLQVAAGSYLSARTGNHVQLLLGAPSLQLGVTVGELDGEAAAACTVAFTTPQIWTTPDVGACFARAEVQLGRPLQQPIEPPATRQRSGGLISSIGSLLSSGRRSEDDSQSGPTSARQDSSDLFVNVAGAPCIILSEMQAEIKTAKVLLEDIPGNASEPLLERGLPTQVFLSLASASAELDITHWAAGVQLGYSIAQGPALPMQPSYPLHTSKQGSKALHIQFSLSELKSRLSGQKSPLHLDVHKFDLAYQLESRLVSPAAAIFDHR